MSWQKFTNVTLSNGSKTVTINGGAATNAVLEGSALVYQNKFYEIEAVAATTFTLAENWPEASAANVAIKILSTSDAIEPTVQKAVTLMNDNGEDFLALLNAWKDLASTDGVVNLTDSNGDVYPIQGFLNQASIALAKMQEFGLGGFTDVVNNITSGTMDSVKLPGFYSITSAVTGGPIATVHYDLIVHGRSDIYTKQLAWAVTGATHGDLYTREQYNGVWQPWRPIPTGYYQPEESAGIGAKVAMWYTGPAVGDGGVVNASDLKYWYMDSSGILSALGSPVGVWKNTAGLTVVPNRLANFTRTD